MKMPTYVSACAFDLRVVEMSKHIHDCMHLVETSELLAWKVLSIV